VSTSRTGYLNGSGQITSSAPKLRQSTLTVSNSTRTATAGNLITLTTSGGLGTGAVSFVVTGTNCSLTGASNNQLTAASATTCSVTATKAGDTTYDPISSASVNFTFLGAQATLTISNTNISNLIRQAVTLTTSGGSGNGAISYSLASANSNCTLSTRRGVTTLTARTATTCSVIATKAAQGVYAAAVSEVKEFMFRR
jgi:hypothetical protein